MTVTVTATTTARLSGSPDADPANWSTNWSASFGLGGRGLIPGRGDDICGLAYYNLALTPSVGLTCDAQWIDGVVRNDEPAVVLGMRLNIDF